MDIREHIDQEIAQMEAQLAAFVEGANQQIAAQQGGIEALRKMAARLDDQTAAAVEAPVEAPGDGAIVIPPDFDGVEMVMGDNGPEMQVSEEARKALMDAGLNS